MKVTINIPDEIYEELYESSKVNTRTITQEVVHRIKIGVQGVGGDTLVSKTKEEGSIPSEPALKNSKELPSQDTGGFKTYFKK